MSLGPATSTIAEAIRGLAPHLAGATRHAARAIGDQVDGPLVVAVAGRLKAGKSTLVNALLGRDVAPTAVGECTSVVARYLRSTAERVVVIDRDGGRRELPLEGGAVPARIETAAGLERLDVHLVTTALDGMILVDTPGLASVLPDRSDRTISFLDLDESSRRACAGADAIIYLLNDDARADDVAVIRSFRSAAGDRLGLSCLAVLNKADQLTGGVAAANRRAETMHQQLAHHAAGVVAIVALAAEAQRCGLVDNEALDALVSIARLDEPVRARLCEDIDSFEDSSGLPRQVCAHLVRTIGLFGIHVLLDRLSADPDDRAGALTALEEASQIGSIDAHIARLARRADALKAERALAQLEQLRWTQDLADHDRAALGGTLATLRRRPELAVIERAVALDAAHTTPGTLTSDELDELDRLFATPTAVLPGDPVAAHAAAWAGARRWQEIAASPCSPVRRQVARAARSAYMAEWAAAAPVAAERST